ncbi:hypothetical protein SBF1_5640008 [Candidatus Desulfosporosinus infrequens]|uniref:Uncharacterized protein n=1 Tax=Candidatus Desulfosporosinus infrequens TaxID=2043169 RepID=A0A2U3LKA7_9FIRM|nr:hypothetical protein SBF1_5640008 [Candidatus Desulfosporosinus infrequens]
MKRSYYKVERELFLNSTKMGEDLYKKFGFIEPKDRAMVLNI